MSTQPGQASENRYSKAQIVPLDAKGNEIGQPIVCMFNPRDYAISRSVNWKTDSNDNNDSGNKVYLGGSPAKLSLELFFDTYAHRQSSGVVEDVRTLTSRLWALSEMRTGEQSGAEKGIYKAKPATVLFQWGQTWHFAAVITDIEQQFTLFMPDGTPVRSIMKTTFEQADQRTSSEGASLKAFQISEGIRRLAKQQGFIGDLRRPSYGKGRL